MQGRKFISAETVNRLTEYGSVSSLFGFKNDKPVNRDLEIDHDIDWFHCQIDEFYMGMFLKWKENDLNNGFQKTIFTWSAKISSSGQFAMSFWAKV